LRSLRRRRRGRRARRADGEDLAQISARPFGCVFMREQIRRARLLRRAATPEEQLLWSAMRGRSLGYPVRRQHPFGKRIFDFYCPAARLAIEIDGIHHDALTDDDNDYWTRRAGIEVLRFQNGEVNDNVFAVLEKIKAEINRGVEERWA